VKPFDSSWWKDELTRGQAAWFTFCLGALYGALLVFVFIRRVTAGGFLVFVALMGFNVMLETIRPRLWLRTRRAIFLTWTAIFLIAIAFARLRDSTP
jgi:hypothetical protein